MTAQEACQNSHKMLLHHGGRRVLAQRGPEALRCLAATPFRRGRPHRHAAAGSPAAAAATDVQQAPEQPPTTDLRQAPEPAAHEAHARSADFGFVCPICQQHAFTLTAMPTRATGLSCPRCSRTFNTSPEYLDLTLTSGVQPKAYAQRDWLGTELFRSPLVSFAYERGWRQGFSWAGFPGEDVEYKYAMDYLRPAYGQVVVDMSCGSGLFTRRFARSGKFQGVVAADFSENMLKQTRTFLQEDRGAPKGQPGPATSCPVVLLRADVGRLPFATGSVAAIHAGAAIHCWPNPQAALAEISRVLAPGGVFVASTFLVAGAPLGQMLGDDLVRPLNQLDKALVGGTYRWWEEDELRDLCAAVGLQDFRRQRQARFILFCATKPAAAKPAAS